MVLIKIFDDQFVYGEGNRRLTGVNEFSESDADYLLDNNMGEVVHLDGEDKAKAEEKKKADKYFESLKEQLQEKNIPLPEELTVENMEVLLRAEENAKDNFIIPTKQSKVEYIQTYLKHKNIQFPADAKKDELLKLVEDSQLKK